MSDRVVAPGRPGLVLAFLASGVFMAYLDSTIVNVALPQMQARLAVTVSQLQWVVAGYTLVVACLLLTAGTLGDLFGRRRLFLAGLLGFTAASALCALAPDYPTLLIARLLQGVGGSVLIPVSLALISSTFPDPARRARAIGVWAGVGGLAMALGPLLGGVLVAAFGWPSIFWINVPIGVLAVLVLRRVLTEHRPARTRRPDVVGQVLFVVTTAALTYALIEGADQGWTSAPILGCFLAAAVGIVAFVRWELRHRDPMVPMELFCRPVFVVAGAVNLFGLFGLYGSIFLLTLYLQQVNQLSATQAGVRFLALNAAVMVCSYLASALAAKVAPRVLITLGSALSSAGLLGLLTLQVGTGYASYWWALVLLGAGLSLVGAPATVALLGSVPAHQAGTASGISNTFRQIGSLLGVAVCGTLLVARMRSTVPDRLAGIPLPAPLRDTTTAQLASGDLSVINQLPEGIRRAVFEATAPALVDGLHLGVTVAAVCAVVGGISALVVLRNRGGATDPAQSSTQDSPMGMDAVEVAGAGR
ncbi:DHA2 family efflux MFS transporter permease subunit [Goodfellowiella coeruleoviolacea]|uniref:Drug resistance transporter, EmrB/QacA subfamily n=1 Tax=Goodfellowiella coeruleoviolacea TaxID=334858 RepID=A0AAE3GEP2_9PSEU|nr:DHA2 family efflux MFS transporter permease subunit [Goodfellowiella coeruleoviolacea]MCP2164758.1 drug resistance transporter, EmrB/QacA subfamily [Goodfellowiella coeruleoviolacea]